MFTVKYRTFEYADQQPVGGPANYVTHEQLHGPFSMVCQEIENGYYVVHAHRDDSAPGMTFGPNIPGDAPSRPAATLWVMNERGATVATYHI